MEVVFGARGEGGENVGGPWLGSDLSRCFRWRGALRFVASPGFGNAAAHLVDDIAATRERKTRARRLGQSRVGVASWRCH